MKWAKATVDVGLMARDPAPMLQFWQNEVGLTFEELLPTGGGNHQHRHAMNGSVLKLNARRDPGPETPPAGYAELLIAFDGLDTPVALEDPEGNRVTRVPRGSEGINGIGIRVAVRDLARHAAFYERALGFERVADSTFRCGDSLWLLEQRRDAPSDASLQGYGFRYVTLQVFDCDLETGHALENGATLGTPARTFGDVARFSMIRDPDGNWIEISQRKSLTGSLD